ncbi:zinc finger protein ZFAT [Sigmodon hispidus]
MATLLGQAHIYVKNIAIFMCKCCNLFSPSQAELLTHVSEKHGEEGVSVDDVIIPLRPLNTPETPNPSKSGDEFLVMKRKRGRPKGSTKKPSTEEEMVESHVSPSEDGPLALEEGTGLAPSSLECSKCCRKFSNARQLRKHICIIVLNLGEEEGDAGATKIIPVEAGPPETGTSPPKTTAADLVPRRGYQEYAIQQTSYEQPMKSSRLGPTQLKIFTCEYCNKVFKFKHSLQAHLRIHTNEKPYKCSQCSYASAIKANLNVHLRKHTGEKFACDYCSFTCLSKGHLKVHIERVHKKIKQHCRFCKKKYSDVKNLIKHIRDMHDPQDKKVKEALDELRLMTREGKRQLLYDCHICERKFKNELDRDRHMLVHGDKWPFACELCGHGATKYQALELHVRKHPFVYVCALCLKKFVSSIRLRSHIQEVHGTAQETLVFTSSINQSFCLLEPGGDIQQEALGDQLQLAAEEFVCPEMDVHKEETCPEEAQSEVGPRKLEAPGEATAPAVPLSTSKTESTSLSPEKLETTVVSSDHNPLGAVSDDFLLKNDTSSTEAHAATETTLDIQHGGSAQTQGEEITLLLAKAKSAEPDPETQSEQTSPGGEQSVVALPASESDSNNCLRSNPVDASDLLSTVADGGDLGMCPPDSCKPSSEHHPGSTAFMKVLDSLQKKQMNTSLCERIRKVYGDLECEYCGKERLCWSHVPWRGAFLPSSPVHFCHAVITLGST